MCRVRGFSKHVGTVLSETAGESETLHVNDPVCTLLRTKPCVALTLGVVTALLTTAGSRKIKSSSILLSDLGDATVTINVLKAVDGTFSGSH